MDVLANDGYVLPLIATDDTHYYDGTDDAKSFLMVEAESGSAEDILSGIRASRFYASQGPELYVTQTGEGGRTIHVRCSPCSAYQLCYECVLVKGSRVSRCEFNKCGIYDAGV